MRAEMRQPFVLVTGEVRIPGYYTLSANIILAEDLVAETVRKLEWPRYPELPVTLIGRLTCDRTFRGQGIGELLLIDALKRSLRASTQVASLAVVVDAKDEDA